MGKVVSGFDIEKSPQIPTFSGIKKLTLFPTQCWRSSPLASTTCPVPYMPAMVGSFAKYTPCSIPILSEGLIVEAWSLISSWPGFGTGLGTS
jgi:hypothetical protein